MTSSFQELFQRSFGRSDSEMTLPEALIRQLKNRGSEVVLTDSFLQNRSLNGYQALTVGFLFEKWLRENVHEKRVGIVLPSGFAATVVNLGCVLAGKTPVNLNFTSGRASNEACIRKAEISTIFSVKTFQERFADFPWGDRVVDVKELFLRFSLLSKLAMFIQMRFLPASVIIQRAKLESVSVNEEVGILFTSGSSGEPKGVVLSHRNVLSNVLQIQNALGDLELKSMLGSLPIFHSFGFTVTLWWPLLGGPRVVTYPSPTETTALSEVIESHQIELLLSTPTFLRAFLRRSESKQLRSLKMVVTGAEKLPLSLLESFEKKFGISVCEGYGMTEASPVVSVNLIEKGGRSGSRREVGTVGKLLLGMDAEIRDPESLQPLSSGSGMIWLRGPNIFGGYLNDSKRSEEVLQEGWYKTGDLGYLNERGFLVISGRLSRFSKIGGEMVPHGVLEEKIMEALLWEENEQMGVAVVGIPDEFKGEAILILTTRKLDLEELRKKLLEAGIPALWIPKKQKLADTIPVLASGKLDLKALQKLALEV